MLCLKDYCINSIIQIIKNNYIDSNKENDNRNNSINNNILKEIGIQYLPSDILESLLKILKNIERWKLNDQIFQILLDSNINYLDLSNEDMINFNNFIQKEKNNNSYNNIYYSLIELNLSFNNIEDCLLFHFLNKVNSLKSLNLSYCTLLEFTSFEQTNNISITLETLNLRGCTNITSKGFNDRDTKYFKHLKGLTLLKLNHCNNISSEAIKYISQFKSLKILHLSHCTLLQAPNSFKPLVENNSSITTLNISYCLVDDESIGTITLNNENSDKENNNIDNIDNNNSLITNQKNIDSTNDLIKIQSLTSLSIRYNRITPKFLKALSNQKELLRKFKHLDLRQSNFIEVENALCLYPYMCSKDSQLYISNNNRSGRRSRFNIDICVNNSNNNNDLINLQELHNRYNNKTMASEDQIQLNRSSLRLSILERQKHSPLILLGEDEKFQASIVKNVLERKNFDVRIATNGKTAFEMYCETPFFELVIMDIYMPVVNGINSVRMIRQFEKSNNRKRTPIIICSGNESIIKSGNNSSDDIGGDAFITKPFRPNLIDLIIKMTQNTSIKT
ncbi:hypothetical protein DICPUDRAFT_151574 [Dictyostelium purpureum]|uniref:Response regulatory domain-containing protein n=1 Tax=Dictyostelium purpureum TaxID=5786 RepID=F0ZJ69_DICPU|nr:uncharacterized protein DICPUDRAFT_151574 [Dictyostelium purpureum]EGC36029.1 hypothetical protein DICPUDRAFT_151574 [Dictyostelium purpureum]|eukprot:XP_003287467.1 hypothetical protein DICPUDRAFT_151574 [Dictyostelium purpureum]